MLPTFTLDQFLEMLTRYNLTIWPLQLIAYGLGILAVLLALRGTKKSGRTIASMLGLLWFWTGVVFNLFYFSPLYSMAYVFAILFVVESGFLLFAGTIMGTLSFKIKPDAFGVAGALLVLYSLVGYPLIEVLLGRGYPKLLAFGLVPCPTTVFTLGILLWSSKKPKWYVLAIPVLYALTGLVPAWVGIVEDIGLFVSGLVTIIMLIYWTRIGKAEQMADGVPSN